MNGARVVTTIMLILGSNSSEEKQYTLFLDRKCNSTYHWILNGVRSSEFYYQKKRKKLQQSE